MFKNLKFHKEFWLLMSCKLIDRGGSKIQIIVNGKKPSSQKNFLNTFKNT